MKALNSSFGGAKPCDSFLWSFFRTFIGSLHEVHGPDLFASKNRWNYLGHHRFHGSWYLDVFVLVFLAPALC
ncbi:hypothetical protein [Holospora undulata]|uniref:Uncharacterized protein n=1 Tax=Holospora undulata HU1 TaxID=1321371 RepID=A0A061JGJ1_9PROT|nr:hypothetical protein [Holospora undulata]ETZ05211.1 hypothetical protein K737_300358 [Holospora undulata HU1]